MPRALIIHATTSGATREVAACIAGQLKGMEVRQVELKHEQQPPTDAMRAAHELLILGTPTYGKGDWHSAWAVHAAEVTPCIGLARQVMLFALGDARGHAASFGGGLVMLHGLASRCGGQLVGQKPASCQIELASPAVINGMLPGLLVQYRRERRMLGERVSAWLAVLPAAWRGAVNKRGNGTPLGWQSASNLVPSGDGVHAGSRDDRGPD